MFAFSVHLKNNEDQEKQEEVTGERNLVLTQYIDVLHKRESLDVLLIPCHILILSSHQIIGVYKKSASQVLYFYFFCSFHFIMLWITFNQSVSAFFYKMFVI